MSQTQQNTNSKGITSITKWLKLITYLCASVLLITSNNFDNLTYLIPVVVLLIFVSYGRDYFLIPGEKPSLYIKASIVLELLLTISIGFFDNNDINLLFYFVCISFILHGFICAGYKLWNCRNNRSSFDCFG